MIHDKKLEIIIRQHRRWTNCIVSHRITGQGNLILTNRRLLFLHRITDSPEIAASIKELADAPIETVLNHALSLHKNSFQIPLKSIIRVGIGAFFRVPYPYFYLNLSYYKGKNHAIYTVAFQFKRYEADRIFHPQIIADWGWLRAIKRAMQETDRLSTV